MYPSIKGFTPRGYFRFKENGNETLEAANWEGFFFEPENTISGRDLIAERTT
jgi:hypothetical protein